MILLITIILIFAYMYFWPKIDYYTDYRNIKHIVIWYNWGGIRKFIHWAAE
jgi:hypothetical protein